ncbi:hypothetical protein QQS21_008488 [Conoideocrella luteorostrata]|uniref:Uncharacterized protein n=1 Tax=Conoideocrella luteorostrata TaxID=1105319 RepID=A0AAJ0CJ50_9HYPO|nr:hypothetical protein QQS21_008488 [Conoideocrella luteorostrata]
MSYTELIKNNGNFEDMFWSKKPSEKGSTDTLYVNGDGSNITNTPARLTSGGSAQGNSRNRPGAKPAVPRNG